MSAREAESFMWSTSADVAGFLAVVAVALLGLALIGLVGRW